MSWFQESIERFTALTGEALPLAPDAQSVVLETEEGGELILEQTGESARIQLAVPERMDAPACYLRLLQHTYPTPHHPQPSVQVSLQPDQWVVLTIVLSSEHFDPPHIERSLDTLFHLKTFLTPA